MNSVVGDLHGGRWGTLTNQRLAKLNVMTSTYQQKDEKRAKKLNVAFLALKNFGDLNHYTVS